MPAKETWASGKTCPEDPPVLALSNEFGFVRLSVDRGANGPRLRVDCPRTGAVGYLDPLEIESLAVARPHVRAAVVNPEHRWI